MITPFLNVSSLLLGLAAWGFGIAGLRRGNFSLTSFALCLLALIFLHPFPANTPVHSEPSSLPTAPPRPW